VQGNSCDGPGNALNDVGLTGSRPALLPRRRRDARERALQGTRSRRPQVPDLVQDEDGCFGERVGQHFLYNHACAALAMAEAYGMTRPRPSRSRRRRGSTSSSGAEPLLGLALRRPAGTATTTRRSPAG
jgi:hypothetical protein